MKGVGAGHIHAGHLAGPLIGACLLDFHRQRHTRHVDGFFTHHQLGGWASHGRNAQAARIRAELSGALLALAPRATGQRMVEILQYLLAGSAHRFGRIGEVHALRAIRGCHRPLARLGRFLNHFQVSQVGSVGQNRWKERDRQEGRQNCSHIT